MLATGRCRCLAACSAAVVDSRTGLGYVEDVNRLSAARLTIFQERAGLIDTVRLREELYASLGMGRVASCRVNGGGCW